MKENSKIYLKEAKRIDSPNFDSRPANTEINLLVIHSISIPPSIFNNNNVELLFTNKLEESLINAEINNHLNQDLKIKNMDKVFQIIIKSAIFEFLYKPNTSIKIIINEYLKASNFFIDDSQTKYLNALLDKISKKIRISNE